MNYAERDFDFADVITGLGHEVFQIDTRMAGYDGITAAYGWTVGKLLRISAIVLVVYGGLLVLTGWRVASAPTGFIPTQDQGYLVVNVQLPDSASVQRTDAILAKIDKIPATFPVWPTPLAFPGKRF